MSGSAVAGASVASVGDVPTNGRAPAKALRDIPEATVARLANYLRVLGRCDARPDASRLVETETVSSETLASLAGVNPAKLRKDLSYLESRGTRGVGYDVNALRRALESALGAHEVYPVAIVGVGHLGSALAGYGGFSSRGFPVRLLLDSDRAKVGTRVAGMPVRDMSDAVELCRAEGVVIGVITTPESAAQSVVDVLLAAGIRSILHFSPGQLAVPVDVEVRRVDLALELNMLAFHESRRGRPSAQWEALQP